jgi:aminoglycoside phosphotransferase (APT) family kinase protein
LSVRLPSGQDYVGQVAKEHRWLPVLAGQLPLPIPEPVALGDPAAGFPWPWSVYRWIEGEPACLGQVANLAGLADLAGFLAALYAIDASGGPPPGQHSAFCGGSLSTWGEQTRMCIDQLAADIDALAARRVWDCVLASPWRQPPVWVHGDMAASNLLLAGGPCTR